MLDPFLFALWESEPSGAALSFPLHFHRSTTEEERLAADRQIRFDAEWFHKTVVYCLLFTGVFKEMVTAV